ncbi:CHAD domain-containing protein [Dokdonella sp.]|uniref:CHAD domain-containing protein n=1 Tax=Dokdonella sp. TaxID=2291710 RepID=UPI0026198C7E|nr:CHAD domain-containing protein [Dokdonella sp.]
MTSKSVPSPADSAAESEAPEPIGEHLRIYASTELARAIACLGWRGGRIHEGVHQARKSLRRTRATLALGAPVLGSGAHLIDRELRRINRNLSRLRDAHALVETLDRLHRKSDEQVAHTLRRARRSAARARAEYTHVCVAADPGLADRRSLLGVLQAAMTALPWTVLDASSVQLALQDSAQRMEAAGLRARNRGDDEDWHRWRRRVRRLSQQLRALDGVIAPPSRVGEFDKRLANLLGEAQDYTLLREHCGKRSAFLHTDRALLRELSERGTETLRQRIETAAATSAA